MNILKLTVNYFYSEAMYNWRSRGIRVMAWTVNHPIEKQHFSRNYRLTYLTDTLIGEASAHSVRKSL